MIHARNTNKAKSMTLDSTCTPWGTFFVSKELPAVEASPESAKDNGPHLWTKMPCANVAADIGSIVKKERIRSLQNPDLPSVASPYTLHRTRGRASQVDGA
uniref:Uncharacterized protein n=1 Tax=Trypanosoma congolense (strain IL3000) TaxID=1068625 RepID=G0URP5_TRYCI|nr:hypothetical protein, unlikely [Trypanosoma congolense IL3000]